MNSKVLLPPESSDFARLDELRKIMINARAAFHGLAEDVRIFVEFVSSTPDFPFPGALDEMKKHLTVAGAVYVHAVGRFQSERESLIDRLSADDPRRAILGVEVARRA